MFGSLKCDCGPQLREALHIIGPSGGGVLLYLRQEGRGIGLANKIRAYSLQDRGLDTVAANQRLGFADDERDYGHAAAMLKALGIESVRLLTNNPSKLAGLEAAGIAVVERVAHHMPANPHNADYLATKRSKSGHLRLTVEQSPHVVEAVCNLAHAQRLEHLGMAVDAVRPSGEADHPAAGRERARRSDSQILDDRAILYRDAELPRRMEIQVRRGLAPLDMLAAAVDMATESVGEADMLEVPANPARRARRGHGLRQVHRQRTHELDRAANRFDTVTKRPDAHVLDALVE